MIHIEKISLWICKILSVTLLDFAYIFQDCVVENIQIPSYYIFLVNCSFISMKYPTFILIMLFTLNSILFRLLVRESLNQSWYIYGQ